MMKHARKAKDGSTEYNERIKSDADFHAYVDNIAERVKRGGERRHKQRIVGIAVLAGLGFGVSASQLHAEESGSRTLRPIFPVEDFKKSAGIAVKEGNPAKEILAVAEIKESPKGNSYDSYDKESVNGFSIQLNAYVDIKTKNHDQYLWVQNVDVFGKFTKAKWKFVNELFGNLGGWKIIKEVDIFKLGDVEKNLIMTGDRDQTEDKQLRRALKIPGGQLEGKAEISMNEVMKPPGYALVYNQKVADTATFPYVSALDISVQKIDETTVKIYFNSIPIKNGVLDWERKKVIVSAKYHDNEPIEDTSIRFGKDNKAAITVGGLGNGSHFNAVRFNAEMGIYSVEEKRVLVPLKLGGTTDPSTQEGITGVQVKQLSPNWVEVTSPEISAESAKKTR